MRSCRREALSSDGARCCRIISCGRAAQPSETETGLVALGNSAISRAVKKTISAQSERVFPILLKTNEALVGLVCF